MARPDFLAIGARSGLIPGTPEYDEAIGIATEHCLWAGSQGLTPLQVMLPLYGHVGWGIPVEPGWEHAIWYVAAAQVQLAQRQQTQKPRRRKRVAA